MSMKDKELKLDEVEASHNTWLVIQKKQNKKLYNSKPCLSTPEYKSQTARTTFLPFGRTCG